MQRPDEAIAKLEAAIDTLTDAAADAHHAFSAAQSVAQQKAQETAADTANAAVSAAELQALKSEITTAIQALNRLADNNVASDEQETNR